MYVVIDTNILVSAFYSPGGKPAYVYKQFLDGDYVLCIDERIYREYEAVLYRDKFHFDKAAIAESLNRIRKKALFVNAPPLNVDFIDQSDKKFYEVAKYCNAILITGNRKHYPDDPIVKSVQEL